MKNCNLLKSKVVGLILRTGKLSVLLNEQGQFLIDLAKFNNHFRFHFPKPPLRCKKLLTWRNLKSWF
jgi:hypothetical protein